VYVPPLIRLAGMSSEVLRELRSHEVGRAVARQAGQRRRLKADAEALSDDLYEAISGLAEHPAKPLLVGLRRALYQGRKPTDREWSPSTRQVLGEALAGQVDRSLAAHARCRSGEDELDELIRSETGAGIARLRGVVSSPAFRRGLLQASAELSADLDKWLADPGRAAPRRLAEALAKYVTRAAAKTSPFSTFMVAGRGVWIEDDVVVRQSGGGLSSARGVLELGHITRSALHTALVTSERTRPGMIIRVNPSMVAVGERLRFLGHPPEEPMITIDGTPAIRACIELLSDDATSTFGDLAGKLAATGNAQPAQVTAFLDHLVEIGLLHVVPQPGGQITTPGEVAGWLRSLGEGFAGESALLQVVSDHLRAAVPIDDVGGHRRRVSGVGRALTDLADRLGRPITFRGSMATFDAAVAEQPLAECGHRTWRPVLDDLQVIRRWLALFSPGLDLKLALDAWWSRRRADGRRIRFLDFYHEVMQEIAEGTAAGKEIGRRWHSGGPGGKSVSDRSGELRALRDEAARMLWRDAGNGGIVSIDPGELTGAVARFPDWVDDLYSVGVYGQPLVEDTGPAFVVNNIFTGYGKGHRRVDSLAGRRAEPWPIPGEYPLFAGLGGSLGTSLNVREPCVAHEIAYPWHGDVRPGVGRLDLRDLWVERDHARDLLRLRSGELDREVRPLHLGMSAPWTLPRAAQLLVRAFGEEAPMPFAAIAPRGHWSAMTDDHAVPRVRVGRVVVRRARRQMDHARVPVRRAGEREGAYLVRLAEWRHDAGIPETSFVKGVSRKRSAAARPNEHKPLFMDFANLFLLRAFDDLLRLRPDKILFEEALPDPMSARENHGGEHVMEMLVDVSAWNQ